MLFSKQWTVTTFFCIPDSYILNSFYKLLIGRATSPGKILTVNASSDERILMAQESAFFRNESSVSRPPRGGAFSFLLECACVCVFRKHQFLASVIVLCNYSIVCDRWTATIYCEHAPNYFMFLHLRLTIVEGVGNFSWYCT